ncbi:interferon-inducible GTPase 1-like [Xenia sp. Carnegie-2017]|uniref:interferon-inducible GTPase 1-like n=1 Tax=Xenia sp. Carnegie-2017 TaxID=2897299 RepID=UPI001F03387A|nr:interferon-inducible GTPase 1-like [Xenia sp. Carnegie-2017]
MGLCLCKPALTLTEKEEIYIIEAELEVRNKGLNGINEFYNNQIEKWHRELTPLHFGLLGLSRSEKSSFMNALPGFEDRHDNSTDAFPTERIRLINDKKKKKNPAIYRYSENKNIIFWDLPDIKTLTCLPSRCCFPSNAPCSKSPCAENFDAFVIFVKSRISDIEKKIAENISKNLRKPFIFVCTLAEDDKKNVKKDKEAMLKNIKTICFDFVKDLAIDESDIYVIDNKFVNKNQFEDIILKLMKRRKNLFVNYLNYAIFVNTKDTKNIFQQAQKHGVDNILDFYSSDSIPLWTDTEINFAIAGDSGTGKSSFINAVRGIKAYEKGAAPVGVTEMTNKPTKYLHPQHKNIIFWDLPGIGTPGYSNLKEYTKKVGGLKKYDAFLIFYKIRFTHYDIKLAEKVSKDLDKPFFFVRTNVDTELENAKDDEGSKFDEASVLKRMRTNCLENLICLIHDERDIFLIDNKATEKYDFDRLVQAVREAMSGKKRESFDVSLSKLTHATIKMKGVFWRAHIQLMIVLFVIAESNPEVFVELISMEVIRYHRVFGLYDQLKKNLVTSEEIDELCHKEEEHEKKIRRKIDETIQKKKSEEIKEELMKDKSVVESPAKVKWAYDYLLNCIKSLEMEALKPYDAANKEGENSQT